MSRHARRVTVSLLLLAGVLVVSAPSRAAVEPGRPTFTLDVDAGKPFKAVDHAASGSLYGLADEGWPADRWIGPVAPKMFTQPPPGATHRPNGEPAPVGDTLKVWPVAGRNGATVTIRLPDIFPSFPYVWQGDDYWYGKVEEMVRARLASGADNIYGYEIWNEPQWTWNPAWGSFQDMWDRTYRLIRSLDAATPIIGPSYDRDYEVGLRPFLSAAVAAHTVPDIVSWHELGPFTGMAVEDHVRQYRALERELGVGPLPISINEYGSPRDSGVPGWLTRFVAKLERAGVDTANLAFWHKPGRLSDLLVPVGGGSGPAIDAEPTGNYALYEWYGALRGQMVTVTPPAPTSRFVEVGTPVPAPSTRVAGRRGNALALGGDAPNRYVTLPPGFLRGVTDFTVAAWVNLETVSDWARVFDFGTGTAVNMFLTPRSGDGAVRFSINAGSGEQRIDGTAPLPTGWTHVAVTKRGGTGVLYVDGVAVGTNPGLTLSPADLAGGDTTQNWIGRSQYADPLLNGTVDDFRFYARAVEPQELADGTGDVLSYAFDETGGTRVVDSSGNGRDGTVTTRTDGVEALPAPDGLAAVDPATRTVRVIFGGGAGDLRLRLRGLNVGPRAEVTVLATDWTGTDGVSTGPRTVFRGTYPVRGGAVDVPVQGMDDTSAYLAVITPAGRGPVDTRPRYEAEATGARAATAPAASGNLYVRRERIRFAVDATVAGAHDLDLRYTNPSGATRTAVVEVGGRRHELRLAPTDGFATARLQVPLSRGRNAVTVRTTAGVDYLDVTPFRARFEAERGERTAASLVRISMDESNFFAPYVSGNAYVGGMGAPESALRLPVNVPRAGVYTLTIGYSTEGTEAERRAQTKLGQGLRVDDGPWQEVGYEPTQFRELIRQTNVTVRLPAGASTLTFTKGGRPGTVLLDYVEVRTAAP